jgi:drug/metabolite transporter (DMT)-like permease
LGIFFIVSKKLGSHQSVVSIIVLLQPVFAAFYAWFIFKEVLSVQELIAILIVLCGIL